MEYNLPFLWLNLVVWSSTGRVCIYELRKVTSDSFYCLSHSQPLPSPHSALSNLVIHPYPTYGHSQYF